MVLLVDQKLAADAPLIACPLFENAVGKLQNNLERELLTVEEEGALIHLQKVNEDYSQ